MQVLIYQGKTGPLLWLHGWIQVLVWIRDPMHTFTIAILYLPTCVMNVEFSMLPAV